VVVVGHGSLSERRGAKTSDRQAVGSTFIAAGSADYSLARYRSRSAKKATSAYPSLTRAECSTPSGMK